MVDTWLPNLSATPDLVYLSLFIYEIHSYISSLYFFFFSRKSVCKRRAFFIREITYLFLHSLNYVRQFSLWSDHLGDSLQFFERDHVFYLQDLVKESVYVLFLTVSQYLAVLDTYGALMQGTSIQEMVLRSKTVPSLDF